MHATYDETITHILDVFERVFQETSYRGRWVIDHAETIKPPIDSATSRAAVR